MITEAVVPLIESGVLNGRRKTLLPGKIVTSFCFGQPQILRLSPRQSGV
ncbi:MAG: hypothetical protein WDM76_14475 [Limisphaerales bacterium]